MPPKSIFRQPGTKHFQLVHRSQRDPLIHDPDASQHVLKEFERGNARKGKSRAELEEILASDDLATRENLGEATLYGVYFDDTEYDYMQHLRPVGLQEDGVDSILIEAPTKTKGKGKSKDPIDLVELPAESLPSTSEIPRNYESQQAVPSSIAGFQPDMDPHLRQVLEALEDDTFVEDELEDDFFGELVGDGERGANEIVEYEFHEDGVLEEDGEEVGEDEGWEARFKRFKIAQKVSPADDDSDLDENSEGADTIGTLPTFSVIGGKKRRKDSSDASGYSMSSSSMFRNTGLTTLDEQFDQIQKEYESDEDNDLSDTDSAPELITSREDFDSMMNEFLDNYEVLGGKIRPVLEGDSAVDKLDTFRKALGEARIREQTDQDSEDDILMPLDIDEKKDRWDCETILTTYSNLENHPRLIRAKQLRAVPKILLDPKTGLPFVANVPKEKIVSTTADPKADELNEDAPRTTITRPKNESKEEKKARKQAVKMDRQVRRADKKAMKEQFSSEIKQQSKTLANKEKSKARKL
ncbi:LTV1 family protein [Abortiporus biennis]